METKKLAVLVKTVFSSPNGKELLAHWKTEYQGRCFVAGKPDVTAYNTGAYEFLVNQIDYFLNLTVEDLRKQQSPEQHPYD